MSLRNWLPPLRTEAERNRITVEFLKSTEADEQRGFYTCFRCDGQWQPKDPILGNEPAPCGRCRHLCASCISALTHRVPTPWGKFMREVSEVAGAFLLVFQMLTLLLFGAAAIALIGWGIWAAATAVS